jgi:hypothetical protein
VAKNTFENLRAPHARTADARRQREVCDCLK